MTLKMTRKLETICLLTDKDVKTSLESFYNKSRGVYNPTVQVPGLTKEHIGQPLPVITQESWQLSYWICRDKGEVHEPDSHHPSAHLLFVSMLPVSCGNQSRASRMIQEEASGPQRRSCATWDKTALECLWPPDAPRWETVTGTDQPIRRRGAGVNNTLG